MAHGRDPTSKVIQISQLIVGETIKVPFEETREHQIELEKSPTALPAHAPLFSVIPRDEPSCP
jgi:hypothetical protein